MSLVAHGGADLINTWGFAYVGGVIGLVSLALFYVKARVDQRAHPGGPNTWARATASLGPAIILVGGACGVSLGLGIAGILQTTLSEDAAVGDVLDELCELRSTGPQEPPPALHDDVLHVIADLDRASAEPAHRALHDVATSPNATVQEWASSIDRFAASLAPNSTDAERKCGIDVAAN